MSLQSNDRDSFDYQSAGRDHLWLHFTRHSTYEKGGEMPLIVRGEGHKIWDSHGREYIDGLALDDQRHLAAVLVGRVPGEVQPQVVATGGLVVEALVGGVEAHRVPQL